MANYLSKTCPLYELPFSQSTSMTVKTTDNNRTIDAYCVDVAREKLA